MYDVAIIGGGPVGSRVAERLVGTGHKVVVLERNESLDGPVCCTGIVSRECVNEFDIDERVVLRWENGAKLFAPSGRSLRLYRPQPQACVLDRSTLNAFLAERAQCGGAEYRLDSAVREVEVDDGGVSLKLDGAEPVRARTAIIASGFAPGLVKELGFGRYGDFVAGAQVEVNVRELDEIEVYTGRDVAPDFFAWLVPTLPGRVLAGLLSRSRPAFYLKRFLSRLRSRYETAFDPAQIRHGSITLASLSRTYADRLLVVGTAAGQVKPTTGGGIYYGLLCADIAAEVMSRALERDDLSAITLAGYERKWKRKLARELMTGRWVRRFFQRLSDAQLDRLFDIITISGIDRALLEAEDLSFDWHGRAAMRLLCHQALSGIFDKMQFSIPSRWRKVIE